MRLAARGLKNVVDYDRTFAVKDIRVVNVTATHHVMCPKLHHNPPTGSLSPEHRTLMAICQNLTCPVSLAIERIPISNGEPVDGEMLLALIASLQGLTLVRQASEVSQFAFLRLCKCKNPKKARKQQVK